MLFADAWLLYKACRGDKLKIGPKDFFLNLADDLVDVDIGKGTRKRTRGTKRRLEQEHDSLNTLVMQAKTAKKRKGKSHCKQSRCVMCGRHTTRVCKWCLVIGNGKETAVCNAEKGRYCLSMHVKTCHEI